MIMSHSKAKSNIKSKHDLYSDRSKWATNGIWWLDHLKINIKSMYLLFRLHWQVVQCSWLATQSKARGGDLSHLICEKCNRTKRTISMQWWLQNLPISRKFRHWEKRTKVNSQSCPYTFSEKDALSWQMKSVDFFSSAPEG